jgi:hypothetical protein
MTWTANLDSFKRATTGTATIAQVTFSNGADAFTETITIDCMDAGALSDAVADRLTAYQDQEAGFNTLAPGPVTPGVGTVARKLRATLATAGDMLRQSGNSYAAEIDKVLAVAVPTPVEVMASSPAAKAKAL